jgi:uncharacterized protein (TIGR02145 family)
MNHFNHKKSAPLFAAVVVAALCFSGCGGKITRQEAAPAAITPDTPPQTSVPETPVTLTDERDGETYGAVKMPGGKTWMARNLNYTPQEGKSWCYDNDDSNCEKYGRLYDWETAMKACPAGWHLPTVQEWDNLSQAAGGVRKSVKVDGVGDVFYWDGVGKKLKSSNGWDSDGNGTDDFGFSVLLGGNRSTDGSFGYADSYGIWWTATASGSGGAYNRFMYYDNDYVSEGNNGVGNGFSVRCVGE